MLRSIRENLVPQKPCLFATCNSKSPALFIEQIFSIQKGKKKTSVWEMVQKSSQPDPHFP